MFIEREMIASQTDNGNDDWAERSEHWLSEAAKFGPKRKRRDRNSTPLILCGHGVSLRIDQGALVIRDGFTHYPQAQAAHRFFPGSLDIPERILLLDGSGTLSFDVLSWLAEQSVALARIKWTGEVATVASGTGYAADRDKVQWQLDTRADETARLAFTTELIRRKLVNSIDTLETHFVSSRTRDAALDKARLNIDRLNRSDFTDVTAVRAIEGECAAAYFAAWQGMPIEWRGTERRPIPEAWSTFTSRSSLASGARPKNRNASHPINAMLNYAYAVKLAHLHIQAIADGYDPTIGIMHHARRGLPAYAFDLIESERPKVDARVLAFVRSRMFAGADFTIRADGVCRLSPQLARAVALLVTS